MSSGESMTGEGGSRARGAGGQVVVLAVAVLVVAALVMLGVVRLGDAAVERARARTAADAAALAGAADGRDAAERLARDNGGRLVAFRTIGPDVVLTVVVGGARATARARGMPRVSTVAPNAFVDEPLPRLPARAA